MKSFTRTVLTIIITAVLLSCSSTLHLYSGQQYFSDEELGTLTVSEQIQVKKFDRKEVHKTAKPPVIKALPGQHRLDLAVSISDGEAVEKTVFWDAIEGHTYQLVVSESEDVTIVEVTDN